MIFSFLIQAFELTEIPSTDSEKQPKLSANITIKIITILRYLYEDEIFVVENYFKNLTDTLNFLLSFSYDNSSKVIFYKFVIDEYFKEIGENELREIKSKFKDKSVIIYLSAKINSMFSLYLKSKDINNFLAIKFHDDQFVEDDKHLYDFVADFMTQSLKAGHLGKN